MGLMTKTMKRHVQALAWNFLGQKIIICVLLLTNEPITIHLYLKILSDRIYNLKNQFSRRKSPVGVKEVTVSSSKVSLFSYRENSRKISYLGK